MGEQFLDGRVTLHAGDCRDVLAALDENSVDSCVCDPPYHLTSIGRRSSPKSNLEQPANKDLSKVKAGSYRRLAAGFMGKEWDGGDVAFQPETWAAVLRVLKPGAYLIAFSGTRTYHRMVCAIEDAGFDVRDQLAWTFGSGFPKSKNLGGGLGTALKPAWEPICLARKPLIGTNAENVLAFGTGGLNIDGCRVGDEERFNPSARPNEIYGQFAGSEQEGRIALGRWPANLIHDGSDEVLAAFPDQISGGAPASRQADQSRTTYGTFKGGDVESGIDASKGSAARFFYQVEKEARCDLCCALLSGKNDSVEPCDAPSAIPSSLTPSTPSGDTVRSGAAASRPRANGDRPPQPSVSASSAASPSSPCPPPSGGSARQSAELWPLERIAQNVRSVANLCHSCETDIARALVEVRRSGQQALSPSIFSIGGSSAIILSRCLASYVAHRENTDTILTTTSLSGLFGSVFHAIGASINSESPEPSGRSAQKRLWYSSKADADDRLGSKHPTVKPLDLMQYLVRLVTPPGGLVLDCFAGTGSTGEAAFREGMRAVLIEREPEYQADIRRRMELAENPTKRAAVAKTKNNLQGAEGTPLFGESAA